MSEKKQSKESFIYATKQIKLSPGGTATASVSTHMGADFYCTEIISQKIGPFKYFIRDSSSDRTWSNVPLHSSLGDKTSGSLNLPEPRLILRGATVTIEFVDQSLAANNVQLAFVGYKADHKFFF